MKKLLMLLALLGFAQAVSAQDADDYRGGWRTDSGEPHTYQFSILDDRVRGIYCTRCSDATTLAFIDGTFGTDGITFTVTHVNADGTTNYQDRATAKFNNGSLIVTGTSGAPGGGSFERTVLKDPRGPAGGAPAPARGARGAGGDGQAGGIQPQRGTGGPAGGAGAPRGGAAGGGGRGGYVPPAEWKQLTEDDVVGVWIGFGVGINKQYFIIRKIGDKLRGMVCGSCDNPYTMCALDDFVIDGDTMTFNIIHEDWGAGPLPFNNVATVRVAGNEMRLTTQQDNRPPPAQPPGPNAGNSLIGPISIEGTRGNP